MINVEHALDVVALAHHEVRVGVVQSVELVLERLLLLADLVQRRVVAAELVDAQLVFLADLGTSASATWSCFYRLKRRPAARDMHAHPPRLPVAEPALSLSELLDFRNGSPVNQTSLYRSSASFCIRTWIHVAMYRRYGYS